MILSFIKVLFLILMISTDVSTVNSTSSIQKKLPATTSAHFINTNFQKAKTYSGLVFERSQTIPASNGVKSVLFNAKGTKLYALNLEAMSIYEYDRASKKITRKIQFKPVRAPGWNYKYRRSISSFAEKPVEGCFTNHDKILWVSLHNSGGIVPLIPDSPSKTNLNYNGSTKTAYVYNIDTKKIDTLKLPLIKTGSIPKVITTTADNKFLLVSNWKSKSISILKLNDTLAPYATLVKTIGLTATPRGIAMNERDKKIYVAIMGGNIITVINQKNWKIEKNLQVLLNPRHIVTDTAGRLFVSFNSIAQIACIEATSGKILFKANTALQPRTIALSDNQKYLFVTCYAGNKVEVFEIGHQNFKKIFSFKCTGKPVGIALYENQQRLEAWVCNYVGGNLEVYQFKKME